LKRFAHGVLESNVAILICADTIAVGFGLARISIRRNALASRLAVRAEVTTIILIAITSLGTVLDDFISSARAGGQIIPLHNGVEFVDLAMACFTVVIIRTSSKILAPQ